MGRCLYLYSVWGIFILFQRYSLHMSNFSFCISKYSFDVPIFLLYSNISSIYLNIPSILKYFLRSNISSTYLNIYSMFKYYLHYSGKIFFSLLKSSSLLPENILGLLQISMVIANFHALCKSDNLIETRLQFQPIVLLNLADIK